MSTSLFSNPIIQLTFALVVVLTIANLTAAASIQADLQGAAAVAAGFLSIIALGWVMGKVGK